MVVNYLGSLAVIHYIEEVIFADVGILPYICDDIPEIVGVPFNKLVLLSITRLITSNVIGYYGLAILVIT